jgi:hypoxanthine phosphoribosyltransferase
MVSFSKRGFFAQPARQPAIFDRSPTANMLTIHDKTFVPFISAEAIQNRVRELAATLDRDYADREPLLVVVLNGAVLFAADLFKNMTIPAQITFIRVSSYEQTTSTGAVKEILGLAESVRDRHLIVVEDIIDTGLTITDICNALRLRQPASLTTATLLFKPESLERDVEPDYVGFEIEPRFVVGYGLDYDGLGRNSSEIFVLDSGDVRGDQ